MRNGRLVVSEWLEALCSCSGATTQTSGERSRAISSNSLIPGDPTPSSLVTRMRALASSMRPSAIGFDDLQASHIGLQHRWERHGAVVPLEVLEDRDEGAPNRETRAVEGVNRRRPPSLGGAIARPHPQRLKRAAIRAAGNLAIDALTRQPDFEAVAFLLRKSPTPRPQSRRTCGD